MSREDEIRARLATGAHTEADVDHLLDRVEALGADVAHLTDLLAERRAVPTPTGVWMVPIHELRKADREVAEMASRLVEIGDDRDRLHTLCQGQSRDLAVMRGERRDLLAELAAVVAELRDRAAFGRHSASPKTRGFSRAYEHAADLVERGGRS